jgi:hypothetical protein
MKMMDPYLSVECGTVLFYVKLLLELGGTVFAVSIWGVHFPKIPNATVNC